jgi:hypothetical protein
VILSVLTLNPSRNSGLLLEASARGVEEVEGLLAVDNKGWASIGG